MCRDPEVDAILLHYGPMADFEIPAGREMAKRTIELARAAGKPLAITVLITLEEEEFFRETLRFPVFHFPEEAVRALALSRAQAARGATGGPGRGRSPAAGGRRSPACWPRPGTNFSPCPWP